MPYLVTHINAFPCPLGKPYSFDDKPVIWKDLAIQLKKLLAKTHGKVDFTTLKITGKNTKKL